MYNDTKTSLVTTDTRVTIKYSTLFPLSDKVTTLLSAVCLKAREVVDEQVHLTAASDKPRWVKDVLKTHLGLKTGMGPGNRSQFDEALLIRQWARVLGRVRAGLGKEYTIADLRPKLFVKWLIEEHDANSPVLGDLARLKVYPASMRIGDLVFADKPSMEFNYRGPLEKLMSDWPPDFESGLKSLKDTSDEELRFTYRKRFLDWLEDNRTRGAVQSTSPEKPMDHAFNGWKKAPAIRGYRKKMIADAKSISLHFGKLETMAGQGDRGLWAAVKLLVHEASHKFAGTLDYAYIHDDGYKTLTMPQAANNADSFAFAAVSNYRQRCITQVDLA